MHKGDMDREREIIVITIINIRVNVSSRSTRSFRVSFPTIRRILLEHIMDIAFYCLHSCDDYYIILINAIILIMFMCNVRLINKCIEIIW